MRISAILLALALSACSRSTPEPAGLSDPLLSKEVCDPLGNYEAWLARQSNVDSETNCGTGPRFWPDDVQTSAAFCWLTTDGGDWVYRWYGEVEPGQRRANELTFTTYWCQFQECDQLWGRVRCTCSGCAPI